MRIKFPTRRKLFLIVLYTLLGILALLFLARWYVGSVLLPAPMYKGPRTEHFDGTRFHNREPIPDRSFWRFMLWNMTATKGEWRKFTDAEPGPPPPARVAEGELRVTMVNHATFLVQVDGVNILTDPIWSERASPFKWAGPMRHRPPGIRFEDLPPIDAVVVSHNHYDHLDIETLHRLAAAHRPRILVGLGNSLLLNEEGIPGGEDMDWGDSVELKNGVRVAFVPAQHWSGRGLSDRSGTLWGGFVIESESGNVFFAGDTGDGKHFDEIGREFAPIRLAILPIGAYLPDWFMQPVHLSPMEAVDVHKRLGAQISVPAHFGTFELAGDGEAEPVEQLLRARGEKGLSETEFPVLEHGVGFDVPALEPVTEAQ